MWSLKTISFLLFIGLLKISVKFYTCTRSSSPGTFSRIFLLLFFSFLSFFFFFFVIWINLIPKLTGSCFLFCYLKNKKLFKILESKVHFHILIPDSLALGKRNYLTGCVGICRTSHRPDELSGCVMLPIMALDLLKITFPRATFF